MSSGGAGSTAADIIARLKLKPHPEGGHYREIFRHAVPRGGPKGERGLVTSIYYLLARGETSAWHRLTDAVEIWHWHAGQALELSVAAPGALAQIVRLGPDVLSGEEPQAVVPVGHWQSARPLGDWTLVGCTVSPAFEFAKFEMAPEGFVPGRS